MRYNEYQKRSSLGSDVSVVTNCKAAKGWLR